MEQKSTKWEYLDIYIDPKKPLREQLNWEGHSEWELVQILAGLQPGEPESAIFKRPVRGNAAVGERPIRDPAVGEWVGDDHDKEPSE